MTISRDGNPGYLLTTQYRTNRNLSRRFDLHRRFSTNSYGWHRWVFDHFLLPEDALILELGCGVGSLWLENRDRIPRDWQITISDFSPGMIDGARQQLRDVAPNISFEVIDVVSIPHADRAFDGVIANHMLYHVPDRSRALREIRRVLRPGGRLYASTNGRLHMWELDELIRRHAPEVEHDDVAGRFGLENGSEQLEPWFVEVDRHVYQDSLEITEAEPLLEYARSMSGKEHLTGAQIDRMYRTVTDTITGFGAFRVTKAAGLFSCLVGNELTTSDGCSV
ncbi:MAG: class I SAM-dependent methyltransferase [Chloroflexota bacterium]|nr:class I SAM-dependent methyltransferase [Chloroflexota bacterium]